MKKFSPLQKKFSYFTARCVHSFKQLPQKQLFAAFGVTVLFIALLWFMFAAPVAKENKDERTFSVVRGQGSREIARNLRQESLVRSSTAFQAYVVFSGNAGKLKAGTYILSPSMSLIDIVAALVRGDTITEHLTVLEGWSLKNIAAELEKKGLFTQEEFYAATGFPGLDYRQHPNAPKAKDFATEFPFLEEKPDYVSLEGFLFPDTYQITQDDTPEDIVRRMLRNFQNHLDDGIGEQIQDQERPFFELLTMASLIEKEVRSLEDKKIVSGILWKRLASNMRLQVDAAVVYIREGNYKVVSIEETQIESPYNTYRTDGLPLGPIANPGVESIIAAIQPQESPYWYYLSPSINSTVFSKSFQEHKRNKAKYLQ